MVRLILIQGQGTELPSLTLLPARLTRRESHRLSKALEQTSAASVTRNFSSELPPNAASPTHINLWGLRMPLPAQPSLCQSGGVLER